MSYSQRRQGPVKVGYIGILQAIADGVKLLSKETLNIFNSQTYIFIIGPVIGFILILILYSIIPFEEVIPIWSKSWFIFWVIMSLLVFPLFIYGWSSRSKFRHIGVIRAITQVISYERTLIFTRLVIIIIRKRFSLFNLENENLVLVVPLIIPIWIICVVRDINRTPLDLAEAESEIVRGFNTDYARVGFTFIFLREYGILLILRVFTSIFITQFKFLTLKSLMFISLLLYFWCIIRATYPRVRYDQLMDICWKKLLILVTWLILIINIFYKYIIK